MKNYLDKYCDTRFGVVDLMPIVKISNILYLISQEEYDGLLVIVEMDASAYSLHIKLENLLNGDIVKIDETYDIGKISTPTLLHDLRTIIKDSLK